MISALLLPLVLAADSAGAQAGELRGDPPIQIWINNDRRFFPGERAKVQVRTEEDGYLLVLHADPDGYLRVLFPLDPDKDNFVRGGKKYEVRGRGDRDTFEADGKGRGTVYAAVSREPFRFEGFVAGDHWDYRTLAPSRLSSNPEPELNELVRRVAQGDFDYDLLSYEVMDRSAYATDYYPRSYGSVYGDPWCYSFSCSRPYYYGSPFSVSIVFGRPYRRYYYDPYFYAYDPFYNPFFYDPYYYSPAYYPRYIYPRPYYPYYPYRGGYYRDRYRTYAQPFTPYRFRGADGFTAGYRGRGYDSRRFINTVYKPPLSPVREPAVATPARRVIAPQAEALPNGVAKRRLVDDARRVQSGPIEARRARPEDRQERSAGEPRLIRREVEARRAGEARSAEPRDDRAREVRPREEPRQVERPAPQARPRREAERASPPPAPDRGSGGRSDARGGGSRESGGDRSSGDGGRRHR
jgi:uncharacterized membrane protein YgcG